MLESFEETLYNYVLCWVAPSCLTLWDHVDCSPRGSSVPGILQARMLEWVVIFSSRGSSQLRDRTQVSRIAGGFFTCWATRGAHITIMWGNSSGRSQKWKLLLAFHLSYTDFFLFFPFLKVIQLIAQASRSTMETRPVLFKEDYKGKLN